MDVIRHFGLPRGALPRGECAERGLRGRERREGNPVGVRVSGLGVSAKWRRSLGASAKASMPTEARGTPCLRFAVYCLLLVQRE